MSTRFGFLIEENGSSRCFKGVVPVTGVHCDGFQHHKDTSDRKERGRVHGVCAGGVTMQMPFLQLRVGS